MSVEGRPAAPETGMARSAPFFTVFTPTYNRAHTLERVYTSLENQTFRDLEWIIVDDGSTDDTRSLVEAWRRQASFPVRYFWQAHGHKKTAFNKGVREANGELFVCADSDDTLLPHALETFHKHWMEIPVDRRPLFSGVCGHCVRPNGETVGDAFPGDVWDGTPLELFYRHHVKGEKFGCTRTDVLRRFPFPEEIAGHVPEAVVWSAIGQELKQRFVNVPVRVYYDSDDSLTTGTGSSPKKDAEGHAFWASYVLTHEMKWLRFDPLWFLRIAANYTRFRKHMAASGLSRQFEIQALLPRCLVALGYPVGCLLYYRDLLLDARRRAR